MKKQYVMKSADGMRFFERVAKGVTTPADVSVNQVLVPGEVESFLQAIIDRTPFLSKISSHTLKRNEANIDVIYIEPRHLRRIEEGVTPTKEQLGSISNIGKKYYCKAMQSFFSLGFSTISDNLDNPNFEKNVDDKIALAVGNDVLDLAWNGSNDTGSTFITLNKGWLALAEEYATAARPTHKLTPAAGTTNSQVAAFLAAALPDQFKASAAYIMSKSRQELFIEELGKSTNTAALLVSGNLPSYLGYPILISDYMPTNKIILTPPTNLAWGINRDIKMYREIAARARAVEYTFDMMMDWEIAINDALAFAEIEED